MWPGPAAHSENTGSTTTISYTPSMIEAIGKQIVHDAAQAQTEHNAYLVSASFQLYIDTAPLATDGEQIIQLLLTRHAERLGQRNGVSKGQGYGSYDWQIQMGNTLKFIAAGITEADQGWANSIKGRVPQ